MTVVLFSVAADATMTALEADMGRRRLLERVDAALAALAANPGDQRCRRRSYSAGVAGMWGMPVRHHDEDWLILWFAGPGQDEVTVAYIGLDL